MPLNLTIGLQYAPPLTLADHTPDAAAGLDGLHTLIGGTLHATDTPADVIICPPGIQPPEDAAATGISGLRRTPEPPAFYRLMRDPASPEQRLWQWRHLLLLACINRILRGDAVALMHGVLLEDPAGNGIFICGQSGMGKSTTAARWQAAGGICRADDMILLEYGGDTLLAHPMPTWSRCLVATDGEFFPMSEAVPVKTLLALDRSTGDECIRETESFRFFLPVYASASCFADQYGKKLLPPLRQTLIERTRDVAGILCDRFPPRVLYAALQGDLKRTLQGFF